jgi:hypothetical protein
VPGILFTVPTPLGFTVRTTHQYWELIQRKHPEVIGKEADVQGCLRQPKQVRRSTQDRAVYLFYVSQPPYYLVVVVKRLNGTGFIITSYLSDKVKEGETAWPTSV